MKPRAEEFLEREGMCEQEGAEEAVRRYIREMERGLNTQAGSLKMMRSFYSRPASGLEDGRILLVDAGGTNLRIAVGTVKSGRIAEITRAEKRTLPGVERPVACEAFFDVLAEWMEPYMKEVSKIGFCFSYTVKSLPDRDGVVLSLAKQVRIEGIEGRRIGAELRAAFHRRGINQNVETAVLNDAVAVLLAGAYEYREAGLSGEIGMVMGTGINFAYFEKERPSTEQNSGVNREQAVNVETSRYDGFRYTAADREMDQGLEDRGSFLFEKSVAGRYLGGLVLTELKRAARAGCFSEGAAEKLTARAELKTEELSRIYGGLCAEDEGGISALPEGESIVPARQEDKSTFFKITDAVLERSAWRVAVCLTAIMKKMGSNSTAEHPVGIIAEGSTFYRFEAFREKIEKNLEALAKKEGLFYRFLQADSAVMAGTAVAAICRDAGEELYSCGKKEQ